MPRNRTRRRSDANGIPSTSTLGRASAAAAAPPRSKAGCWTCRIRRKRCDELQNDAGACQACVRLGIECLGWGSRRPDWCRDKQALADYKLRLKKKLCSRAGTRPSAGSAANAATRRHTSLAEAISAAAASSTSAHAPLHDQGMTRAPSGESPSTAADSDEEDQEDDEDGEDAYERVDVFNHHPSPSLDGQPSLNTFVHAGLDTDFDLGWPESSAVLDELFSPASFSTHSLSPPPTTMTMTATNYSHLTPPSPIPQFTPTFVQPQPNPHRPQHSRNPSHQRHPSRQFQPITKLAPHLPDLLSSSSLPMEYRQILAQILELYAFKTTAQTTPTVEQHVARQAQSIEEGLNKLARRSSFDLSFSNLAGCDFDPSSFYLASTGSGSGSMDLLNTPASTTSAMSGASFNSPMTVWSPDLVPDSLSTFSSSAPTSPAAPLLAMSAGGSGHQTSTFGDLFGYEAPSYDPYLSIHALSSPSTFNPQPPAYQAQHQQQAEMEMHMSALGLGFSNDLYLNDFSSPTFQVFPSNNTANTTPTASMTFDTYSKPLPVQPTPTPSAVSPSTATGPTAFNGFQSQPASLMDSDPYGIHYETCALLLRVVLVSPSREIEDLLESLTTKFAPLAATLSSSSSSSAASSPSASSLPTRTSSPLSASPLSPSPSSVPDAYLFSATVAGALTTSMERRSFFFGIVKSIEERSSATTPMGLKMMPGETSRCGIILNEVWAM
ncbi:hypothetical protein FRC14_004979 [Serendipita sp. 396]|nr:hypothetical protein FRC14_004979 [Serendipita sp. 396]KAG8787157.1 hypothetical protein FRC15_009902 [Serendipita sp. 397]KAG8825549.1 hypothetical protein FRC19_011144 [Serendipita sp. 401]